MIQPSLAEVYSGTYTPIGTVGANADAVSPYTAQFMKIGNVVTVSGMVAIDPTAISTDTIVELSLPIPSDFNNSYQLAGTMTSSILTALESYGVAKANTANDTLELAFVSNGTASRNYIYHATYLIR